MTDVIKYIEHKIRGYTDISFQKKSVALLYIFRGDYEPQALSMLKYNQSEPFFKLITVNFFV